VAESQDLSTRIGLTRGKLVLIGILAIVLVGVLYMQYGAAGTDSEAIAAGAPVVSPPSPSIPSQPPEPLAAASTVASARSGETPTRATGHSIESFAAPADQKRWKSPELASIIQYDPFARPAAFPRIAQILAGGDGSPGGAEDGEGASQASQLADAVEQLRNDLEALRQRGVHVIVKQRDEYVALIGDRTIHVGDEINGFTVTSIDPQGVRVEKKVD
jgi:hypothetical protein